MQNAPLILTAELPRDLHGWATRLRAEHFPPERNYLEAHVTLFHALAPQMEAELLRYLSRICGETAPVLARMEGVMSLGRGTALKLSSSKLLFLRQQVAEHCHGMLTAQDQASPRLHVTIQNKVEPVLAKALQQSLGSTIRPRNFFFRGLTLHRYLGGPWELVKRFPFRG
ncbi:2'-5' RNA ligase family protein [Porphyrobacter algicida]|uniref:2'-5' RNA ligase family protein n=1 Tax=Qipengyuania algicida TaxID=1836209 RepID=A0A845AEX2_9SPHN|nr:2'-5' RNA ligase family protein [Qipengyuania algicida]